MHRTNHPVNNICTKPAMFLFPILKYSKECLLICPAVPDNKSQWILCYNSVRYDKFLHQKNKKNNVSPPSGNYLLFLLLFESLEKTSRHSIFVIKDCTRSQVTTRLGWLTGKPNSDERTAVVGAKPTWETQVWRGIQYEEERNSDQA